MNDMDELRTAVRRRIVCPCCQTPRLSFREAARQIGVPHVVLWNFLNEDRKPQARNEARMRSWVAS